MIYWISQLCVILIHQQVQQPYRMGSNHLNLSENQANHDKSIECIRKKGWLVDKSDNLSPPWLSPFKWSIVFVGIMFFFFSCRAADNVRCKTISYVWGDNTATSVDDFMNMKSELSRMNGKHLRKKIHRISKRYVLENIAP